MKRPALPGAFFRVAPWCCRTTRPISSVYAPPRRNTACAALARRRLPIVHADADGSDVTAIIGGVDVHFRVPAPGAHMVMNALAALTAAQEVDADVTLGAAALGNFTAVHGRGARQAILDGAATLIDESYNASAASVRAALSVLRLAPALRRVAVLGDMLELGEHSRAEHEGLAQSVRDSADIVYACGPWMRALYDALPDVAQRCVRRR